MKDSNVIPFLDNDVIHPKEKHLLSVMTVNIFLPVIVATLNQPMVPGEERN